VQAEPEGELEAISLQLKIIIAFSNHVLSRLHVSSNAPFSGKA
jgi:hypothetical protein